MNTSIISFYKRKYYFHDALWLIGTILMTFAIFFPLFWMVSCSIRPLDNVFKFPSPLLPDKYTLDAYKRILTDNDVIISSFNTIFVSSLTTLGSLFIASIGAYGLSRYAFKGKRILTFYILATQMIPLILLTLPYYRFFVKLGLFDKRLGLIIAYISFTLPFCTLTLTSFFNSIPRSLDESSKIDGCSPFGTFFRICMPLIRQGMVATGIFAFITAWNEYLFASLLAVSDRTRMLVVFIGSKIGQYSISWTELMASTVLASLPLIIIYIFMQKSFMRGITSGAIKM